MQVSSCHLMNSLELSILLTVLATEKRDRLPESQYQLLRQYIQTTVDDGNLHSEMGWEELAYTSTAHLLRTCLSKKQSQGPVQA